MPSAMAPMAQPTGSRAATPADRTSQVSAGSVTDRGHDDERPSSPDLDPDAQRRRISNIRLLSSASKEVPRIRGTALRLSARESLCLDWVGTDSSHGREAVVGAARRPGRNPRSAVPRIAAARTSADGRTERRLDVANREYVCRWRPAPHAALLPLRFPVRTTAIGHIAALRGEFGSGSSGSEAHCRAVGKWLLRSGPVCLNSFPRFISGLRAVAERCRVVHGGGRRLRRTDRRGGQLGAHRGTHLMRPTPAPAAWRSSARPALPHSDSSALGPRCTSPCSRRYRRAQR